jgi:hypothetical protein
MDAQQLMRQEIERQLGALLLANIERGMTIEVLEQEKAALKIELAEAQNQLATHGTSPRKSEDVPPRKTKNTASR